MKFKLFVLALAISFSLCAMEERTDKNSRIEEDMPFNPMALIAASGGSKQDLLLARAMLMENDETEAYKIYSKLANQNSSKMWHAQALLQKGKALETGKGTEKNIKEAITCYQKCYKIHKDPQALLSLGDLYDLADNYSLAAAYYKKAFENGEPMAGYRYARLLYLDRIKYEFENIPQINIPQIVELLFYIEPLIRASADKPLIIKSAPDALFMYATLLLENDLIEKFLAIGLPALHLATSHGDAASMHQLGILYRHGLYVEKDIEKAKEYFAKALNSEDKQENLVTKAYMYMRGDGVQKDKEKAVRLLDQASEGKWNIQSILDNYADEIYEVRSKWEEDALKKQKPIDFYDNIHFPHALMASWFTPREVKPLVIRNILDTLKVNTEIPQVFPYKTIVEKCNALSQPIDGSLIAIDVDKQLVLINDDIEPAPFTYDKRIKKQLTASLGNKDPHKFGIAADYVMQLFGVLNPYLSLKKNKEEDNLVHPAEQTKPESQEGHFEYGFFKSKKGHYKLYHRFFKKLPKKS